MHVNCHTPALINTNIQSVCALQIAMIFFQCSTLSPHMIYASTHTPATIRFIPGPISQHHNLLVSLCFSSRDVHTALDTCITCAPRRGRVVCPAAPIQVWSLP